MTFWFSFVCIRTQNKLDAIFQNALKVESFVQFPSNSSGVWTQKRTGKPEKVGFIIQHQRIKGGKTEKVNYSRQKTSTELSVYIYPSLDLLRCISLYLFKNIFWLQRIFESVRPDIIIIFLYVRLIGREAFFKTAENSHAKTSVFCLRHIR